jgi:hypothetical protein
VVEGVNRWLCWTLGPVLCAGLYSHSEKQDFPDLYLTFPDSFLQGAFLTLVA